MAYTLRIDRRHAEEPPTPANRVLELECPDYPRLAHLLSELRGMLMFRSPEQIAELLAEMARDDMEAAKREEERQ